MLFVFSCTTESSKDLDTNFSFLFDSQSVISSQLFNSTLEFKNRFYDIKYKSNDLKVRGFVALPRGFDKNKKYPVIIYNRGGNRDLGMIKTAGLFYDKMTQNKYLVFASQYRGSKGSEGEDQFGGKDINDVINLVKIVSDYPFVDKKNIFNIGISRGAMMTYVGMYKGLNFNASVVWGGVTNAFLAIKHRPRMEKVVYSKLVPNYYSEKRNELKKRSSIYWPERINTPLLFLHGEDDWRVRIDHSKLLIEKLKKLNKPYQFKFYKNGSHGLEEYRDDVFSTIHSFFNKYMK